MDLDRRRIGRGEAEQVTPFETLTEWATSSARDGIGWVVEHHEKEIDSKLYMWDDASISFKVPNHVQLKVAVEWAVDEQGPIMHVKCGSTPFWLRHDIRAALTLADDLAKAIHKAFPQEVSK
jgi:hypothetical protein